MSNPTMSDKLAFSAVASVLMMTAYVLFGADAARVPFGPAHIDAPQEIAVVSLPSLRVVLDNAKAQRILY